MSPNNNGMRAPVFSHFTVIENSNGSLGNFQAECKICKKGVSSSKNCTSNLIRHLQMFVLIIFSERSETDII